MARAATTTDAFNAVAEPRRRQILDVIAAGEWSVTQIIERLALPQPLVSKHLRVLREVGLVDVREDGRQRMYRLNADALRPIYDWVKDFEQLWTDRFRLMDEVLAGLKEDERKQDERNQSGRNHAGNEAPEDDDDEHDG